MSTVAETMSWNVGHTEKRANDKRLLVRIEDLVSGLQDFDTAVRCLTFPAANWDWECQLAERFPDQRFDILGMEQHPDVYEKLVASREDCERRHPNLKLMVTESPMSCLEVLSDSDPGTGYDLVYLDYCGTWSGSKKEELTQLFTRNFLKPHSQLHITFQISRGGELAELRRLAPMNSCVGIRDFRGMVSLNGPRNTVRLQGIPMAIIEHAHRYGITLTQDPEKGTALVYSNSESAKSTPMTVFIFTVTAIETRIENQTPEEFVPKSMYCELLKSFEHES